MSEGGEIPTPPGLLEPARGTPTPPERPQIGAREPGYRPRRPEAGEPVEALSPVEPQAIVPTSPTAEPQARMGLRDRLANLRRRATEPLPQEMSP